MVEPLVNDPAWEVRFSALQVMGRNQITATAIEPMKKLAQTDVNPLVRGAALFNLSRVDFPEAEGVLTTGLKDNNFMVRQAAVVGLTERIAKQPSLIENIKPLLNDSQWQVRQAAVVGFADGVVKQPSLVENIKPLLNDSQWQVRQAAVQVVGRVEAPQIPEMLIPKLQDPSAFVRQATVENLGVRVHSNERLINPLISILKNETDPWTRQLAGFSLNTVKSPAIESVRPLINQIIPNINVVVITGGIDDLDPRTYGRESNQEATKNWPLRQILELAHVPVIEPRWSGRMWEIPEVQKGLDQVEIKALELAGNGNVLNVGYSAGQMYNERLFEHIKPGVHTPITEAINAGRIKIIGINPFSNADFSRIDKDAKSFFNPIDILTWVPMMSINPVFGVPAIDVPRAVFDSHRTYFLQFPEVHAGHKNPQIIDYTIRQVFPGLSLNQNLNKMFSIQPDISKWYFDSVVGFGIKAPADYYINHSVDLDKPLTVEHMQQFRGPDNCYLQQNQFQVPTRIEIPVIPLVAAPKIEVIKPQDGRFQEYILPNGSVYREQSYYTPSVGSWPGTYNFNIRAQDNYYQKFEPVTTPMPAAPVITPINNYRP